MNHPVDIKTCIVICNQVLILYFLFFEAYRVIIAYILHNYIFALVHMNPFRKYNSTRVSSPRKAQYDFPAVFYLFSTCKYNTLCNNVFICTLYWDDENFPNLYKDLLCFLKNHRAVFSEIITLVN